MSVLRGVRWRTTISLSLLRGALESIPSQSFSDWELITVDDVSQDETPVLLRTAARSHGRIRVIRQSTPGFVEALQRGCAEARGHLPDRERAFILADVSSRGARELIAAELFSRGWIEGRDFLLAA